MPASHIMSRFTTPLQTEEVDEIDNIHQLLAPLKP